MTRSTSVVGHIRLLLRGLGRSRFAGHSMARVKGVRSQRLQPGWSDGLAKRDGAERVEQLRTLIFLLRPPANARQKLPPVPTPTLVCIGADDALVPLGCEVEIPVPTSLWVGKEPDKTCLRAIGRRFDPLGRVKGKVSS